MRDVFNQVGFWIDLDNQGITQDSNYKWPTRRVLLTLTYKFGKLDNKLKLMKSSGGGADM